MANEPSVEQMRKQLIAAGSVSAAKYSDASIIALWRVMTPAARIAAEQGVQQGDPVGVNLTAQPLSKEAATLLTEAMDVSEVTQSELSTILTGQAPTGVGGELKTARDLLARARAGEGIFAQRQQTQQTIDLLRDQPGRNQVIFAPAANTGLFGGRS